MKLITKILIVAFSIIMISLMGFMVREIIITNIAFLEVYKAMFG